ncbi:MAG TPA: phosphoribosylamine--glycine ligase [Gemmatimonadaceae bacterium]
MKVLVVGGGGREHALAWRLRLEDPTVEIVVAPGNPGIAEFAKCVPIAATDVQALLSLAKAEKVDWTLVGPEASLAAGIVDEFRAHGFPIFGPTRDAAMLETSKAFSKSLMIEAKVPTAQAAICNTIEDAYRAIDVIGVPVVVKASGLAAGKGVIIAQTIAEARGAARAMLESSLFGDAGTTVLIEEFMTGEELSVFVLTDGERMIPLPAAQDHKRLLNGDEGPNTGGMGAYCPVSLVDDAPELIDDVLRTVVAPTLAAMRGRGTPFTGLLYVGLMLTSTGPKVVEFNCRYGDPETEAVLPAISPAASLGDIMHAIAHGGQLPDGIRFDATHAAVTTVVAASGYPDKPRVGDQITLPYSRNDAIVFHAGTKLGANGELVTSGGRVLAVTGVGDSIDEAQRASQALAAMIEFAGKQYRTDIGWREMARRAGAT